MSDLIFYSVGVVTCVAGAIAIVGLIFWQALEWWIKFSGLRKPLMEFYAERLKTKRKDIPA